MGDLRYTQNPFPTVVVNVQAGSGSVQFTVSDPRFPKLQGLSYPSVGVHSSGYLQEGYNGTNEFRFLITPSGQFLKWAAVGKSVSFVDQPPVLPNFAVTVPETPGSLVAPGNTDTSSGQSGSMMVVGAVVGFALLFVISQNQR